MLNTLIDDLADRYLATRPRVQDFGLIDLPIGGGMQASAAALFACATRRGLFAQISDHAAVMTGKEIGFAQSLIAPKVPGSSILPDEFTPLWRSAQQEAVAAWFSDIRATGCGVECDRVCASDTSLTCVKAFDSTGALVCKPIERTIPIKPAVTPDDTASFCLGVRELSDLVVMNHAPMLINYLVGLPFWWSRLHVVEHDLWVRVLEVVAARACVLPAYRLRQTWRTHMSECEIRCLQYLTPPVIESVKAHLSNPKKPNLNGAVSGLASKSFCFHVIIRTISGGGLTGEQAQMVRDNLKRDDAVGFDVQGDLHVMLALDHPGLGDVVLNRLRERFPSLLFKTNL